MNSYSSNFIPVSFSCTMCGEPHSKYLPPGTKMTSCGKCGNLITIAKSPSIQSRPNNMMPRGFRLPEMSPYRIPEYDSDEYENYHNEEEEFNQFLNEPITRTNNNPRSQSNSNGMFSIHVPNDRFNNRRATTNHRRQILQDIISDEEDYFEAELNDFLNQQSIMSQLSLLELKNTVIPSKPKLKKVAMTRKMYTKNAKGKLEAPVCCICLVNMKLNDSITQLKCKHMFHYLCLDKWIQTKEECPFCRGKIAQ